MLVGVRPQKRAQEAPSAGSAPRPSGSSLESRAQGACAEGGAQAVGKCSQRLRRAAASLARTDAIIASPRQTPREFRSPHGNCSSRSRSRLHSPFPRGESESESEISVRPRPAPPPTVANGRGPHAGLGGGQRAAECPRAASALPPAGAAGTGLGVRGPAAELAFGSGASAPPGPAPGAPVTASARGRRAPCPAAQSVSAGASRGAPGPCAPPCRLGGPISRQFLALCPGRVASPWRAHPPLLCSLFTSGLGLVLASPPSVPSPSRTARLFPPCL